MKAKKSFGQHFLNSETIAQRIANGLQATDSYQSVLEVGPGKGMLTKYLIEKPYELVVVEADKDMVMYLNKHYPDLKDRIVSMDFLKVPLDQVMQNQAFGLIGNFPYNISSQILFKMLDYKHLIPEMVGMFQKEVAERVIAKEGSKIYGVISILIQIHYEGHYLFTVDKSKFTPPPKVQSAVIRMVRREKSLIDADHESLLKRIVKISFSQRRKMIKNTIKTIIGANGILEEPFFKKRPEQLSVDQFIELTHRIKEILNQNN